MPERRIYNCNDGGIYYYTGYTNWGESGTVVWFGGSPKGAFGNVFWGDWVGEGQLITGFKGEWFDVPYGTANRNGILECHYIGPKADILTRKSETGGFGGSRWEPRGEHMRLALHIPENPVLGEGLTGIWKTNTETIYYIRQSGDVVVWFAANPTGSAANVFRGARIGNSIEGQWIDVSWGHTDYSGDLTLEINDFENALWKVSASADYGCSTWQRIR